MPISTNFTQTSRQSNIERTLKGNIQMWHILLQFMIRDKILYTHQRCQRTPRLKHRLRDSRHSSAWFIYEGCHRTDGLGSYTRQQITRACLPTLLKWHTLTRAHTHVFQLCNCYQLHSSTACSGGKWCAVNSIRGRGCVNGVRWLWRGGLVLWIRVEGAEWY